MNLRIRVVLIFSVSFIAAFLLVFIMFYISFQLSDQRLINATLIGQTSTWKKVQEATYQRMLFHAYDESPGKASIWRLRGKRSPIQAIKSGNSRRLVRSVDPFYKYLSKSGVLDFIWIIDLSGKKLAEFGTKFESNKFSDKNLRYFKKFISYANNDRKLRKQIFLYEESLYSALVFPIYENARKIAFVIYGKNLIELVDDLAINTKTIALVKNNFGNTLYKTTKFNIPIDVKNQEIDFFSFIDENLFGNIRSQNRNFIEYESEYFRYTKIKIDNIHDIGEILLLTNSTKDRNYQVNYLIAVTIIILGLALLTSILINIALRRGFKPLDRAIDVLGALSRGDTTVDINSTSTDEVGRISSAVSSFRTSLIEREKIRGLFGKYIPEQIAAQLLDAEGSLEPQLSASSILFVDLAGFTALCEDMEPEAIVTLLNEYFSAVVEIIEDNGGVVAQFQGDALLAVFNNLFSGEGHECKALNSALEIKSLVSSQNFSGKQLACRIGLASGNVVSGNVGAKDRLSYTVYGDVVNLAARLETLNKEYETVLLFDETISSANSNIDQYEIGKIEIRGKRQKVRVFSVK